MAQINLTLAQLRTFERIVRLGSFSSAAKQLGLTQPSVSQRIKELEIALGTDLFVRQGPRLSLTANGHALLEYADRMLDTESEIAERFRSRDPLRGRLRLGLIDSFALICLSDLLASLEKEYPDVRTSVYVGDSATVSRMMNERELDVAIAAEPDLEPHVHAQAVGVNDVGWVASTKLDISNVAHTAQDLARYHLFINPPPTRLNSAALDWFAKAGVSPPRVSTCNNLQTTVLTILDGLAIGLVPLRVLQPEIRQGRAKHIPITPQIKGHEISLCYQANEFGPHLQHVLDIIRRLIADYKVFSST